MAVDEGETPTSKRAKDVLILNPGNTITPARVYRVTENNGFFIPWSCIMGKIPILTKPPTGPRELVKFKTARVQIVINTPPEFDFEGANWPINLIWIIDLPRPLLVGSGYEALHVMFDKPGDFWKGGEVLWESEYWNAYRAWPLMEREDDGKIRGIVVDGREYPLIPDKHDGGDIQEVEVYFWEVNFDESLGFLLFPTTFLMTGLLTSSLPRSATGDIRSDHGLRITLFGLGTARSGISLHQVLRVPVLCPVLLARYC
jgi:hypothetical protein